MQSVEVDIDLVLSLLDSVRAYAMSNPEYGFDDGWMPFMKKMRLLTAQSSGARIQNYIFRSLGWEKVSPYLNKGDVKNSLGQYFEVKVTTITSSNKCANIVQIRLWQLISGHHIFVINSEDSYRVTHFTLSKFDMEQEVSLCGSSAHGTKDANKSNQRVEWAIRIPWDKDNEVYIRWVAKYKQDSEIGKMESK